MYKGSGFEHLLVSDKFYFPQLTTIVLLLSAENIWNPELHSLVCISVNPFFWAEAKLPEPKCGGAKTLCPAAGQG